MKITKAVFVEVWPHFSKFVRFCPAVTNVGNCVFLINVQINMLSEVWSKSSDLIKQKDLST